MELFISLCLGMAILNLFDNEEIYSDSFSRVCAIHPVVVVVRLFRQPVHRVSCFLNQTGQRWYPKSNYTNLSNWGVVFGFLYNSLENFLFVHLTGYVRLPVND